tara:strand:+ start:2670 stop:4934 length:2265 start_codon:yes stop_codon:yes gene_type:complete
MFRSGPELPADNNAIRSLPAMNDSNLNLSTDLKVYNRALINTNIAAMEHFKDSFNDERGSGNEFDMRAFKDDTRLAPKIKQMAEKENELNKGENSLRQYKQIERNSEIDVGKNIDWDREDGYSQIAMTMVPNEASYLPIGSVPSHLIELSEVYMWDLSAHSYHQYQSNFDQAFKDIYDNDGKSKSDNDYFVNADMFSHFTSPTSQYNALTWQVTNRSGSKGHNIFGQEPDHNTDDQVYHLITYDNMIADVELNRNNKYVKPIDSGTNPCNVSGDAFKKAIFSSGANGGLYSTKTYSNTPMGVIPIDPAVTTRETRTRPSPSVVTVNKNPVDCLTNDFDGCNTTKVFNITQDISQQKGSKADLLTCTYNIQTQNPTGSKPSVEEVAEFLDNVTGGYNFKKFTTSSGNKAATEFYTNICNRPEYSGLQIPDDPILDQNIRKRICAYLEGDRNDITRAEEFATFCQNNRTYPSCYFQNLGVLDERFANDGVPGGLFDAYMQLDGQPEGQWAGVKELIASMKQLNVETTPDGQQPSTNGSAVYRSMLTDWPKTMGTQYGGQCFMSTKQKDNLVPFYKLQDSAGCTAQFNICNAQVTHVGTIANDIDSSVNCTIDGSNSPSVVLPPSGPVDLPTEGDLCVDTTYPVDVRLEYDASGNCKPVGCNVTTKTYDPSTKTCKFASSGVGPTPTPAPDDEGDDEDDDDDSYVAMWKLLFKDNKEFNKILTGSKGDAKNNAWGVVGTIAAILLVFGAIIISRSRG